MSRIPPHFDPPLSDPQHPEVSESIFEPEQLQRLRSYDADPSIDRVWSRLAVSHLAVSHLAASRSAVSHLAASRSAVSDGMSSHAVQLGDGLEEAAARPEPAAGSWWSAPRGSKAPRGWKAPRGSIVPRRWSNAGWGAALVACGMLMGIQVERHGRSVSLDTWWSGAWGPSSRYAVQSEPWAHPGEIAPGARGAGQDAAASQMGAAPVGRDTHGGRQGQVDRDGSRAGSMARTSGVLGRARANRGSARAVLGDEGGEGLAEQARTAEVGTTAPSDEPRGGLTLDGLSSDTVVAPSVGRPSWFVLAERGDFVGAAAALDAEGGFDVAMRVAGPDELMALVDVARSGGRSQLAIQALRIVIERYRENENAPLAAMMLGNLLHRAGDAAGAAEAFALNRRLSPGGDFAEDALVREFDMAMEAMDLGEAERLFAQYEQEYPDGRHRDALRADVERLAQEIAPAPVQDEEERSEEDAPVEEDGEGAGQDAPSQGESERKAPDADGSLVSESDR